MNHRAETRRMAIRLKAAGKKAVFRKLPVTRVRRDHPPFFGVTIGMSYTIEDAGPDDGVFEYRDE